MAAASHNDDDFPNGTTIDGGSPQGQAGSSSQPGGERDAGHDAAVTPSRFGPASILFVIDGSASMCEVFDGVTRWQALHEALLDPTDGLIVRYQNEVNFGAMIFDGSIDLALVAQSVGGEPGPACASAVMDPDAMDCPHLTMVAPALQNAAAIDAAYPMKEPAGSTPTDKALNIAVDQAIAEARQPIEIVLITDGLPNDLCTGGLGGDGLVQQQGVIAAADRAATANVRTRAIALSSSSMFAAYLDEVARHGAPRESGARAATPLTREELNDALTAIVVPPPPVEP